jgi:hypothetical protein
MSENLCGKCNVCCIQFTIDKKFLSWRDTDKAAGEICDKLVNYECSCQLNKPKTCNEFECFWLNLLTRKIISNKRWRPDKVGLVITSEIENKKVRLILCEINKGSFDINNLTVDQVSLLKFVGTIKSDVGVEILTFFKAFDSNEAFPIKLNLKNNNNLYNQKEEGNELF